MTVARPALWWFGGKWRLAPWLIEMFPPHRRYVEPFGGAASVLLRKPRSYAEIYNDLDDDVVNLFRVLRDPDQAARLKEALQLTPFARREWRDCYALTDDPVEGARRLVVLSFMGFGANSQSRANTGFRAYSDVRGTTPEQGWRYYPDSLAALTERLRGVVIEHRDAIDVMREQDGPDTLHYVDPPYLHATRGTGISKRHRRRDYRHEMSDADHAALLGELRALRGMVVLSGYASAMYDESLPGWTRIERAALADGARPRTEVVWLNPVCAAARKQTDMFDRAVLPIAAA
jgi:DNA adenine methylase